MLKHLENGTGYFNRETFKREIGVSVRALKWDLETEAKIADILEKQIRTKKYNYREMRQEYYALIDSLEKK